MRPGRLPSPHLTEDGQPKPQMCTCGEEMWLMSVTSVVSDGGSQSTYKYECRNCRSAREVKRKSEWPDATATGPAV